MPGMKSSESTRGTNWLFLAASKRARRPANLCLYRLKSCGLTSGSSPGGGGGTTRERSVSAHQHPIAYLEQLLVYCGVKGRLGMDVDTLVMHDLGLPFVGRGCSPFWKGQQTVPMLCRADEGAALGVFIIGTSPCSGKGDISTLNSFPALACTSQAVEWQTALWHV